jgi:hypothetical protein
MSKPEGVETKILLRALVSTSVGVPLARIIALSSALLSPAFVRNTISYVVRKCNHTNKKET